jgi:hypothetical protein
MLRKPSLPPSTWNVFAIYRSFLGPTQLFMWWVSGALSLGLKFLEPKANHLCPPVAEPDSGLTLRSVHVCPFISMAWYLVQHGNNFFYFSLRITRLAEIKDLRQWN